MASPASVEFRIVNNGDAAARATADLLLNSVNDACAARGRAAVALAGGSTPRAAYELLSSPEYAPRVPWNRVDFFFGDERAVPPDHTDSNYKMACDAMFTKMCVAPDHVHRMEGETASLDDAARRYESEIRRIVPAQTGEIPQFDLILLGMGPDGHTASLFPGSPALDEKLNLIIPAFGGPVPIWRLTFTYPILNAARAVVITATGVSKAPALRRALDPADPDPLPVARVRPAGRLTWILDAPLASAAGIAEN